MINEKEFNEQVEKENSEEFFQEKTNYLNNTILPFYKNRGETELFLGQNDIAISCRFFRHKTPRAKVILMTGYRESYLKYAEFIENLYQLQVSVYCYDHRGQGFSGRFFNQNKRGYVDNFDNFIEDFHSVYDIVQIDSEANIPIYIIAHSLGGAVATLGVIERKLQPKGIILSSPMYELHLTPWPILQPTIHGIAKLVTLLGQDKAYAPFQGDCVPFIPFETNDVTHSKVRFLNWRKHISEINDMQLGGPTFGWLNQSMAACNKLKKYASQNTVPITIMQAENDTVVSNLAQNQFVDKCPYAKTILIPYAKHEILMEVDCLRNMALNVIKNALFSSDT